MDGWKESHEKSPGEWMGTRQPDGADVRTRASATGARPVDSGDDWRRVLQHAATQKQRFNIVRLTRRNDGEKCGAGSSNVRPDRSGFTTIALNGGGEA